MNLKNKVALTFVVFIFFFCSCNVKYSRLAKIYDFSINSKIEGKIKKVTIIDLRKNTEDRKLKIPAFTFPGNYDKLSPKLTERHRYIIDSFVRTFYEKESPEVELVVSIIRGEKEFFAKFSSEIENVYFDIKIQEKNLITNKTYEALATVYFTFSSHDASEKFLEELYLKAIKASIHKSIVLIEEEKK